MKKMILLITTLLVFSGAVYSQELQGGVKFNVDSARNYVQQAQTDRIKVSGPTYFLKTDKSFGKIVYSYNNSGDVIGVTVQSRENPLMAYIYGSSNNLKYVDKYDRDINLFPHRGYRYNLDGRLILTSLTVSKYEQFRFSPGGKLLAHSIRGVIYDESGNQIGSASSN